MSNTPPVINVHTPSSSFAVVHSLTEESLQHLFEKLTRKCSVEFGDQRVAAHWVKYQWNESYWNLDDDADYTIFIWRQKTQTSTDQPTLHVHNPSQALPIPPDYRNHSFYLFHPSRATSPASSSIKSDQYRRTKASKHSDSTIDSGVPKHKKEFEKFHSENGVRTVMGSIGPVENVRMLLKNGYRHVYMSRKFAIKHGFIPGDAAPGHYGYGGLVNLGNWPITLNSASSHSALNNDESPTPDLNPPQTSPTRRSTTSSTRKTKTVSVTVYLSEEPHFDIVLGRSFFERRQIKTSPTDPTDVVCLDTGEKIECELVVLKDGKGEIVIVT